MLTRSHIIKKQVLDATLPAKYEQDMYYSRLKEIYNDRILPRLEKVADEYCDANTLVRFDTIEIDTGRISFNDYENEFPEKVEEQFREVLKQALSKTSTATNSNRQAVTGTNSTFEMLEYFLKTGDLPWYINNKQTVNIDELLLEAHKTSADKIQLLLWELAIITEVSVRIQNQFNAESLHLIRQILSSPIISVEYYLITGNRPWWISNNETFAIADLLSDIKKEHISELRHLLVELSENPGIPASIKTQVDNKASDIIHALKESPLFELEYFLKTGEFTSFTKEKSSPDVDKLVEKLYEQESKELSKLLIEVLQSPDVAQRIQTRFSEVSVNLMVQLLKASLPLTHLGFLNDLGTACVSFASINLSLPVFNQLALPILAETISKTEPIEEFASKMVKSLAKFREKQIKLVYAELLYSLSEIYPLNINKRQLPDVLENFKMETSGRNLLKNSDIPAFAQIENFTTVLIEAYQAAKVKPDLNTNQINNSKETIKIPEIVGKRESGNAEKVKKIEESYIDNAGAVILWPYLQLFYEHLEYTKKGMFVSEQLQKRAIHMLHYLVWDEEKSPEYRLLLNKILCGYDISKPIELEVKFTKDEKKSAVELLEAVVKNWPVIKNTSATGLRETFLQRNGIIRLRDEYWTLQVEQKTIDILIEKLPWAIGTIKLPWMNEILYVEW